MTEHKVLKMIPVLDSQPAGDVSHKPGGMLSLLSTRPQLPSQLLRGLLPDFAAWWTEARQVWPTASRLRFEPRPFCTWVQHANHSSHPYSPYVWQEWGQAISASWMALVCFSVVIRWTLTKPVTLGQFCNFCQCQNIVLGDGQQDVSNADIWQKQKIMLIYKGFKSPFLDDWFVSLLTITSFFLCVLLHQIRSEIMMDLIMLCVWWICFFYIKYTACFVCLTSLFYLFAVGQACFLSKETFGLQWEC